MQRIPDAMFQALQRQGAEETESNSSRGQASTEGGQTSAQTSPSFDSQARQSSVPFSSDGPYSAFSPPSTPPALDSETSRYSRLSRNEVSRGGPAGVRRRSGVHFVGAETTVEAPQPIRPVPGPRALGAPSWAPATETVPSQLLGRSAKGNANLLGSDTIDFAYSSEQEQSTPQETTYAERESPLLTLIWNSSMDTDPHISQDDQRPQTKVPVISDSDSSYASTSKSKNSNASSFAPLLHDRRDDLRLFKKKSKPSQHLRKAKTVVDQRPPPRRSSSYYKPKVVEDSAALLAPPPPQVPLEPPVVSRPTLSGPPPRRPPLRAVRSSQSQSGSDTTPLRTISTPRHPVVPIFKRDHDFSRPTHWSQRHHTGTSSPSDSHSRDSSRSRPHLHPNLSSGSIAKRRYRTDTPPEEEPHLPFDSANKHGIHYFRTFGTDTVYQKADIGPIGRVPTGALTSQETLSDLPSPTSSRSPSPNPSRDNPHAHARFQKRGSIFGLLRHPGAKHHHSRSERFDKDTLASPNPGITISSPQLAKSRRRSTITSYFMRPRHVQHSSEASPSPAPSGLSTNWEDVFAESQSTGHAQQYSEPMSPMSLPSLVQGQKPALAQDITYHPTQEPRGEQVVPTRPSVPTNSAPSLYKSPSGEEFFKAPKGLPKTLSFLPTEMQRVDTPPESKRPTGFKGFFFDMRSMPDEATPDSSEARGKKRRLALTQPRSMQSLVSKISFPKLKRKSSQTADERRISEDPLAVTGFQQTPFSQRYGDARRAKMSQIRSYMEEALKEDEDDESSAFPFTLNVPDHLPNSPLCPLSPKHLSGGKAICPIHRRKRITVAMPPSRPSKVLRQGPTIVYESGQQGGMDTPEVEDLRRGMGGER